MFTTLVKTPYQRKKAAIQRYQKKRAQIKIDCDPKLAERWNEAKQRAGLSGPAMLDRLLKLNEGSGI